MLLSHLSALFPFNLLFILNLRTRFLLTTYRHVQKNIICKFLKMAQKISVPQFQNFSLLFLIRRLISAVHFFSDLSQLQYNAFHFIVDHLPGSRLTLQTLPQFSSP